MEEEARKVCIGDVVYLRLVDPDNAGSGWLCAEGHLNDTIFCSSVSEEFHHGLWEVYIQNQYSSMNEYLEALLLTKLNAEDAAKNAVSDLKKGEKKDQQSEMLHQLEKAAANEQKLNERIYQSKIGTPCVFGDTIQLRHVQSRRFLSVSASDLATQERENMRVMSILNGDPYSCISILPKTQMNEGALVNSGFECCLRVNERPGEFVRCAKPGVTGKAAKLEVNCSLERSFWSINVYQSGKEFNKIITAGKPVSLSDSETFSFLAINDSEIDVDTIDPNASATAILKPPVLVTEEASYYVGVGSLWRAEKKNVSKGGAFMIGQDKLLLCHMNSGMYLHSKKADGALIGVKDRVRAGEFNINFAKDSNFKGMEMAAVLEEGNTVTLSHTVYFGKQSSAMHIGLGSSTVGGGMGIKDVAALRASPEIGNAVDLIASGSIHSKHDSDIYFGIDANRCIINFRMAAAEVGPDDAFDSPHMILASQAYKSLLSCLDQLCEFLNDRHIKARSTRQEYGCHSFGIAPETSEKLMARQSMMKEQGLLDSIMDILEECIMQKFDGIKASVAGFSNANLGSAGHAARTKMGTKIAASSGGPGGSPAASRASNAGRLGGGTSVRAGTVAGAGKPVKAPVNRFQKAALGLAANAKMREDFVKDVVNKDSDSDSDDDKKKKTGPSFLTRMSRMTVMFNNNNKGGKPGSSYVRTGKDETDGDDSDSSSSSSSSSSDSDSELAKRSTSSKWLKGGRMTVQKKSAAEADKKKAAATVQGARNMFGLQADDKKGAGSAAGTSTQQEQEQPKSLVSAIFGKNTSGSKGGVDMDQLRSRRMSNVGSTRRVSQRVEGNKDNSIVLPSNVREVLGETVGAGTTSHQPGKRRSAVSDELADMMLRSLLKCIKDHLGNQVYISDRISVLLMHVHKQEYAVNCLQELLRANEVILQTKIRQEEINIFIDLLCQSPMNVSFLQLLQSVCTSPHSGGVDKTQQMVSNALWGFGNGKPPPHLSAMPDNAVAKANAPNPGRVFGGAGNVNEGLMVNMFTKYNEGTMRGTRRTWVHPHSFSYFPPNDSSELDDGQEALLGFGLVVKGLPHVAVNFYDPSSTQSRSMLKLFGSKDEIPFTLLTSVHIKGYINSVKLRELNKEAAKKTKGESNRRSSSSVGMFVHTLHTIFPSSEDKNPKLSINDEFRVQVSEYMLAELHLVADLSQDRNYVSIGVLEGCFPYDMLVTVLLDEEVAPHFKAAVCRILRCLWIDREPQIPAVFPRLIRSSKATDDHSLREQNDFSRHHKGSPYYFCLLQQLLSDYFRQQFDCNSCDELSVEMAKMLFMLIDFGFYSRKDQLEDIILPLLLGLDHSNVLTWSSSQVERIERDKHHRELLKLLKRQAEERRQNQSQSDDKEEDAEDKAGARRRSSGGAVIGGLVRLLSFKGMADPNIGEPSKKIAESQVAPVDDALEEDEETEEGDALTDRVVYKTHRQMLAAKRKSEEVKRSSLHTLEGKFLAYTESTQGMAVLMVVVLLSVVISILTVVDRARYGIGEVLVIDFICSLFFMGELALRMYAVVRVREGGLIPYFMDPLNLLDLALVILDVVILSVSDDSDASAGKIARFARVIRFFRMLRIMRVLRLMKILANVKRGMDGYELPERYSNITPEGGETFTTILKSINLIYSRIQDNSLEMIIQAFQEWVKVEQAGEPVDAEVIIRKYIEMDDSLGLIPQGFDLVLADLIMYDNRELTNEALYLLMLHKNKRQILLDLSKDIQIVYSPKVEAKLSEAKQALQSMRRIAEKYELWQALKSEEDLATHQQLNSLIDKMINLMKKINEEKTLAVKREYIPDEEVQNLLRNLSAMACFMTVIEALYDGGREEPPEPIKMTMRRCMMMVSMFVLENPRNQALAFNHLFFFVDRVDDGLNTAMVVKSILEGNSELIKKSHKRCTDEFAQKIFNKGRKPEYMEMFLGLTSSTAETFDGGMRPVHNNISRYLTSREWQVRILQWCCQIQSAGYTKRLAEMEKVMPEVGKYVSDDELPANLRYHISLLEVLASCSLGPKLQAIYQFDDMVHAIIDSRTLFNVKIALGRCMEQVVINSASHFTGAEYMWQFFDYFSDYLQTLSGQMDRIFRRPHSPELVITKTQIGTWLEVCLSIIHAYFTALDLAVFGEILYHDASIKHTQRVESDILTTIRNLYNSIRVFLERFPLYIGPTISERGNFALVSLARHSDTINYNYEGPDPIAASKRTQRASVTLADVQQQQLRHKFAEFTRILQDADWNTHDESISFFMNLPTIDDDAGIELNVESLITKLMGNLRSDIKYMPNSRVMGDHLQESIWLLRTLRRLFEKFMEKSIEFTVDLNIDACKTNSETEKWRDIFNQCGVTRLCIDFIAVGMDATLQLEAINLLVVMLAQRGGSALVQEEAYRALKDADSTLFFLSLKEILGDVLMWYQKEAEGVDTLADDESVLVLPDETIALTLIQLLCEGDFIPMKSYMREQEGNKENVNIPHMLCSVLDFLSRRESPLFTHVSITIVNTIRAIIHGPCRENQRYLVMNTEVLVCINRLMRSSRPKTHALTLAWNQDVESLKACVVDLLRSLIEGSTVGSYLFDRVLSSIELNVLSLLLMPSSDEDHDVLEYGYTKTEAKYMVFLSTLEAPGIMDTLSPATLVKRDESIGAVEIRWQKQTYKVFFHKPKILDDLSSDFIEEFRDIDAASQEDKLVEFLQKCKALYIEAKHQQLLKQYGLSYLWARRRNISWFLFVLAGTLNLLLLIYYKRDYYHNVVFTEEVDDAFTALLIIQILTSVIMAVLYISVRMPSRYLSNIDNGATHWSALVSTVMDPLPLWYCMLVALSILAYSVDKLFSAIFLLEFVVLDGTTQYLLKAVSLPFRNLMATFLILAIAIHIFSGAYFELFSYDLEHNHVQPIYDLWSSFRLALTYGLRGEYGVDHEFYVTIGPRMWLDLAFYFIILAILRHIFFAIIVETFGQLREEKNEREEKGHNSCFVCGVARHDYEKLGLQASFQEHRNVDHTPENYVHFIFALLEQQTVDDLGVEMYVRKCIRSRDRWESISWIPIGIDKMYSMRPGVRKQENIHGDDSLEVFQAKGKKSNKRDDDDDDDDDDKGDDDHGDEPGDRSGSPHGHAHAPPGLSKGNSRAIGDDEIDRSRMSRISSFSAVGIGAGPFGNAAHTNKVMNELTQAIASVGNQLSTVNNRLDSMEHNATRASGFGVVDMSDGKAGMTPPPGSPPYNVAHVRQPLPSYKHRHQQLKGPSVGDATVDNVVLASSLTTSDAAARRLPSGDETKDSFAL